MTGNRSKYFNSCRSISLILARNSDASEFQESLKKYTKLKNGCRHNSTRMNTINVSI